MFLPTLIILIIAILGALFSLRFLILKPWLKVWIKSSLAILSLFLSIFLALVSVDLWGYSKQSHSQEVAQIFIKKQKTQHYDLSLEAQGLDLPITFDIRGDMWQLDLRLLVWDDFWFYLGLENAYKFERLSGRYHLISDEYDKPRTLYDLRSNFDGAEEDERNLLSRIESWIGSYSWLPGANILYGSSAFMPLNDGARYNVVLSKGGLQVLAQNSAARKGLESWEWAP